MQVKNSYLVYAKQMRSTRIIILCCDATGVYKDKVYQNCLVRLENKEIADSDNLHNGRNKRKAQNDVDGQAFVERERPTKRTKTVAMDKSHLKCVADEHLSLVAGNQHGASDLENDEVKEFCIVEEISNEIYDVSEPKQDDYYYYTGSWQTVLTNGYKKIAMQFLDFGLHQKPRENVQEKYVSNYCAANHLPSDAHFNNGTKAEKQEYVAINRFPYNMNFDENDIEYISAMLTRKSLFKKIDQPFVIVTNVNIDGVATIAKSVSHYSCYCLFQYLRKIDICYQTLQMMYILFMTKWLLVYDEYLDCWILKKDLLPIHVYFGECYVYVMWKLKHLNIAIAKTHEKMYKEHLITELQYFCIIMDLYDVIKNHKTSDIFYERLVAFIYFQIEALRGCISNYLQIFNEQTCTTSLYFVANNMRNMTVNIKSSTPKSHAKTTQEKEQSNCPKKKQKNNHNLSGRIVHTAYYYRFHAGRYTKNCLLILAFTAEFEFIEKKLGCSDILTDIIKAALEKKRLNSYCYKKIIDCMCFKESVDKILEFFIMLNKLKESEEYFVGDLMYYVQARTKIWSDHRVLVNKKLASTHTLNAYREAILMSMGINILDLIEKKIEDQEANILTEEECIVVE